MRLPRDVSGERLAVLLGRYGYEMTRQTGSHLRLTSTARGREHHITIPKHAALKVGTLSAILSEVAAYLESSREDLVEALFSR
ncbi:putative periplasmic/secreted lipoprotein [Gaiella occulta]|uniref:Putative periplasmic/secreted lipoprotein n=1 Tax=Gaiella occulta TaxID=1002870 RepID=A0A7M2Z0D4_9ACTN|nr:type II toxin-antitoxin system HicA family toxin [Gaiella occulta]RDI75578.1 putative periplasmic/secreted lipoprotein [Gaiella occulta]